MRMNSAICALFGTTAAMGALAASLPVSAATVTINDSAGSASQAVSGTTPSITVDGVTIPCGVGLSITPASGITVGTAYTPPVVLGYVVSVSFPGSNPFCTTEKAFSGSAPASSVSGNFALSASHPWPILVTSVINSTMFNVTIEDVILYVPAFGYCYGNVIGVDNSSTNVISIPTQTLTHANDAGVVIGTCTIDPGLAPSVLPSWLFSNTYP